MRGVDGPGRALARRMRAVSIAQEQQLNKEMKATPAPWPVPPTLASDVIIKNETTVCFFHARMLWF